MILPLRCILTAVGVAVEITVRNMIAIRLTVHLGAVKEKKDPKVFYTKDLIKFTRIVRQEFYQLKGSLPLIV